MIFKFNKNSKCACVALALSLQILAEASLHKPVLRGELPQETPIIFQSGGIAIYVESLDDNRTKVSIGAQQGPRHFVQIQPKRRKEYWQIIFEKLKSWRYVHNLQQRKNHQISIKREHFILIIEFINNNSSGQNLSKTIIWNFAPTYESESRLYNSYIFVVIVKWSKIGISILIHYL